MTIEKNITKKEIDGKDKKDDIYFHGWNIK